MPAYIYMYISRFYMLPLSSVDSGQLGCGLARRPLVIGKDHWQILIESTQYSYPDAADQFRLCAEHFSHFPSVFHEIPELFLDLFFQGNFTMEYLF